MEHGQATAIARGMIAKMGDPTGRYREIEIATGLDSGAVRLIVYRMRSAGLIPTPRKKGCTKTDIARQMLIDGIGEPIQYDDIANALECLYRHSGALWRRCERRVCSQLMSLSLTSTSEQVQLSGWLGSDRLVMRTMKDLHPAW